MIRNNSQLSHHGQECTPKSLQPKRGIHGSNRDKSQDEAAGRSKKTVKSKDESQKEASRKRALALMDINVDELEQEDKVDELEDDNMPQSDEHGNVDQEESRDKVHKDDNDDNNNNKYIEDDPDSANKEPTDLDDEVKHEQGGRPSSCHPHGSKLGKTSLASFKSTNIHHLAKLGHHCLCQHVATIETFPFPVDKDELCWKLVQESAVKEPGLEQVLAEIWGAATQVRGELIAKARLAVPTTYGLQGESLKGNALFDVLKWLIQQGKLIHSGIDTKSMTCDESKPWKNPIFLQLIKMQWWGPKGEGRHLGLDPATNPYLNAPATTLALVATAVECVLTSLFSGGMIDFIENVYHGRWNHSMKMLAEFKMRSPTYLQMVQESIQQGVGVHPVQKEICFGWKAH
ncbi:hypothetical protein EDC04DRAFT_2964142 [Pisolithus marmoratus]|nr:hypothetical protein EDC04DRAFT_2964142 [Pisolithus marmoratus]